MGDRGAQAPKVSEKEILEVVAEKRVKIERKWKQCDQERKWKQCDQERKRPMQKEVAG